MLLKFEVFLHMVDSLSLVELDSKISKLPNKEDLEVIHCYMESRNEIINKLNTDILNIKVIPELKHDIHCWKSD